MGSKPGTASEYFGAMGDEYDSLIHRALPNYDEMIRELTAHLPENPRRALELGCGTGNFTIALAAHAPDCAVTVVDASPEMIDLTRHRLVELHPNVVDRATFVISRFEDLDLEAGAFDLIVSCISLHHVTDKGPLFSDLHAALSPGGALRFADQMSGDSQASQDRNWERWLEYCREPGHCTDEEIQGLLDHAAAHDHYVPLAVHFEILEATGFTGIDCVWRNGMWAVVTADRRSLQELSRSL
ncbi:MAG: hypothetical protein BMS9Abin29_1031 [Gemmatimonadota bacterium]|nr:MAG: hypothetical protein BMS9Abin29_1031 [Gemmatimonadota bacterium]